MSTPPPSRRPTTPTRRRAISGSLTRLGIWLAILTTWEAAYRLVGWHDWVFPAPSHIADGLLDLLNVRTAFGEPLHAGWPHAGVGVPYTDGSLLRSALVTANLVSLGRLLEGFAISVALGVALGLAMWRSKPVDGFLGPLFLGLQTLPSVCWVPLGIIAFGLTEQGVQFVLVMGSFFAIAIAVRDGLRTIPPLYGRAGLMLGARGWRLYRYVLLPASLPALAGGLRQGFSFAWRSLMGAEFVFSVKHRGLGLLLQNARDLVDPGKVLGIMIVMVVIGIAADRLVFAPLQRRVAARFGLAGG